MNPAILIFLKRWWPALAGAVLLAALLSLTYCKGQEAGKSSEVIKQQSREIETQKDLTKANEKAADQRMSDAQTAAKQQKELTDALQATTDPDRQRALRGCIILRQQGRDVSNIPACR